MEKSENLNEEQYVIQSEQEWKQSIQKMKKCLRTCGNITKDQIITSWESQKGKKEHVEPGKYSRRNNDWKYSDFGKTTSKAALWENYKELYSHKFVNLDQIPQKEITTIHSSSMK